MESKQNPLSAPVQPLIPQEVLATDAKDIETNKDLAALSYVWILAIVVYATRRDSPFIRFHALQGIILFLLSIAVWFVPYVGKLLELCIVALCALGFLSAAQGEWKDQPVIGPLARGEWKLIIGSCGTLGGDILKMLRLLRSAITSRSKETSAVGTQSASVPSAIPVIMAQGGIVPAPGQASSSPVPSAS